MGRLAHGNVDPRQGNRMKAWLALIAATLLSSLVPAAAADTRPDGGEYAIVGRVDGPDGMWDDAAVDATGRRLYLAQTGQISMLNLADGRTWSRVGLPSAMWHGVVPLEDRGLFIGANGQSHAVTVFDAANLALVKAIPVSTGPKSALSGRLADFAVLADPDALVIEPHTGLIAAVNGGSGEIALVDVAKGEISGRIQVGGKLEFAVADGHGRLYVNVQTAHEIAVVDVAGRRVVRRLSMRGCVEPKGLAYDRSTDLLVSGCDNGIAKFIIAHSGREVASLKTGNGADAVIIDEQRHRAFVPSPADGMLRVFDIKNPAHIRLVQTLATEPGVRLGALDPATGRLYLPAARLGPPVAPYPWPSMIPGTFHILVVAPTEAAR
jgi:DNA-binding beta-propeller fold protein YncE